MRFDWKALVKSLAPTLGAAVGGPAAGSALAVIGDLLLGNSKATEQQIEEAVKKATPEDYIALRQADNDYKLKMEELGVDVFKLEVDDRKDARSMAKVNMWPQIVLSALFITGYFVLAWAVLAGDVELTAGMMQVATMMLGVLTGAIPQILGFWFGSSSGSKDKTQKLGT